MKNLQLLTTFLIIYATLPSFKNQTIYGCHDDASCAMQTLSSTSTDLTTTIECYGYRSCFKCPKIESTSATVIQCFGSFSCYKSDLIQYTGPWSVDITCMSQHI